MITALALIIGAAVVGMLLGSSLGALQGFGSSASPSPGAGGAPVVSDPAIPSAAPSETPPSATPTASRLATPAPTAALPTPSAAASPQVYVVQRGDTLLGIAETFGVALADLVRVNEIEDPNQIVVGQRLEIPGP